MCKAMEEWGEDLVREGREQGIKALIWENVEDGVLETRIIEKLQKYFGLDKESAQSYFSQFAGSCPLTP